MLSPENDFSIIIPTLNEHAWVKKTILHTRSLNSTVEIIVADGGSSDGTVKIARNLGAKLIESDCGRGNQCNCGASLASGRILIFLHADTLLPANAFNLLSQYFQDERIQIGTFRLAFDQPNPLLRAYCFFTRFDSIFTRFGDQCIVVRKSFFETLGRFPNWPLFEDVHLLRNARKCTKVVSFPATVETSARRFLKVGIVKTQLINGWLILQYLLGVSPTKLVMQYKTIKNNNLKGQ